MVATSSSPMIEASSGRFLPALEGRHHPIGGDSSPRNLGHVDRRHSGRRNGPASSPRSQASARMVEACEFTPSPLERCPTPLSPPDYRWGMGVSAATWDTSTRARQPDKAVQRQRKQHRGNAGRGNGERRRASSLSAPQDGRRQTSIQASGAISISTNQPTKWRSGFAVVDGAGNAPHPVAGHCHWIDEDVGEHRQGRRDEWRLPARPAWPRGSDRRVR